MTQLFCRATVSVLCLILLSGCANSNAWTSWFASDEPAEPQTTQPQPDVVNADSGIRYRAERRELLARQNANAESNQGVTLYRPPTTLYQPSFSHKSLVDYAEQLTMELVRNGRQLNTQSRVGVASFVHFDPSLRRTSALGNQLAELLISEVQSFGVPVIDFKTTNAIAVGSRGDLVFSRQAYRLANNLGLDYVLSGTLIESETGVRVNARIIAMDSKMVVSSATLTVPHFVVQALQPKYVVIGD